LLSNAFTISLIYLFIYNSDRKYDDSSVCMLMFTVNVYLATVE